MTWGKTILQNLRLKVLKEAYQGWLPPKSKVLDVGCGDMSLTRKLAKEFELDMTGTDIKEYGEKIKLIENGHFPFIDNSFDFALFNGVLHHCHNPRKEIDEALRVAEFVLIFEGNPTIRYKILEAVTNPLFFFGTEKAPNLNTFREWMRLFEGHIIDYRIITKPVFTHFAFRIEKGD